MAEITARAIVPVAVEMPDGVMLRMVEEATHAGYPMDAAVVLLIEMEGLCENVEQVEQIREVCQSCRAREVRVAKTAEELMARQFKRETLETMGAFKRLFDPEDRMNPGKMLPTGR